MRFVMISVAAMSASIACVGLFFLYALVAPTRPAPSIAIAIVEPHADWRGGPVEDWRLAASDNALVRMASDSQ